MAAEQIQDLEVGENNPQPKETTGSGKKYAIVGAAVIVIIILICCFRGGSKEDSTRRVMIDIKNPWKYRSIIKDRYYKIKRKDNKIDCQKLIRQYERFARHPNTDLFNAKKMHTTGHLMTALSTHKQKSINEGKSECGRSKLLFLQEADLHNEKEFYTFHWELDERAKNDSAMNSYPVFVRHREKLLRIDRGKLDRNYWGYWKYGPNYGHGQSGKWSVCVTKAHGEDDSSVDCKNWMELPPEYFRSRTGFVQKPPLKLTNGSSRRRLEEVVACVLEAAFACGLLEEVKYDSDYSWDSSSSEPERPESEVETSCCWYKPWTWCS